MVAGKLLITKLSALSVLAPCTRPVQRSRLQRFLILRHGKNLNRFLKVVINLTLISEVHLKRHQLKRLLLLMCQNQNSESLQERGEKMPNKRLQREAKHSSCLVLSRSALDLTQGNFRIRLG